MGKGLVDESWCIRKKGTEPLAKTGISGIDEDVEEFVKNSKEGETRGFYPEIIMLLDWVRTGPLWLTEEGIYDDTTQVTTSHYSLIRKIENIGEGWFKIHCEDERFQPVFYKFKGKFLEKI